MCIQSQSLYNLDVSAYRLEKPPRLLPRIYLGTPTPPASCIASIISEEAFRSTALPSSRTSTRNPASKPTRSFRLRRRATCLVGYFGDVQGAALQHFPKQRTIHPSRSDARLCTIYMFWKPRTYRKLPCCAL